MKGVVLAWMVGAALVSPAAAIESGGEWLVVEVAPLTGPAATVGTRLDKATRMWVDDVNAHGGIKGKTVKLVVCNDEGRPEKAVVCTRDAVRDRAVVVLAHTLTASLRAMQPVLAKGPVMIIASPNVAPDPETDAFQTSPSDASLTEAIADYVKAQNLNRIGVIAATDASGEVGVVNAAKIFAAHGIQTDIARVDLKAADATRQIASVAGPDTKIIYSSYSGAGAATVVKSFTNLGLKQPLIVSYANLSQAFIDVLKDVMPPRLMGTAVKSLVPDTLDDPILKRRAEDFMAAYKAKFNEQADMLNILSKFDTDTTEAILKSVADPYDVAAVKRFLETTLIESVQRITFSPTSHVGLTAKDVIIAEYAGGTWKRADPIK